MNFDQAFPLLVNIEGGYVNDPNDPGGETKYGISKRSYPQLDIKNLTLDQAKQIYLKDYWGIVGCDAVPDILKYDLFDMSVNQGQETAIKCLQHAVGETEDGILGPHTLQAVQSTPSYRLLFRFDAARLVHYAEALDASWLEFGRGWIRRVANNMLMV